VAVLCLILILQASPARAAEPAGTPYVDGISDQSLPAWDGDFSESYFARLFSAVWVGSGHIRLARYVAQWDLMREGSAGANSHGDYRERLEAWLSDVGSLGLVPEIALTSYDGVYPQTLGEYQMRLSELLDLARAMGHPVRYVEAWNEPNGQGAQTAAHAAQLTNSAAAVCAAEEYGCTVVAGNLLDAPGASGYEREYERALDFSPAIWGLHPYFSVELESEAPLESLIENLPGGGAGERIWFTEVAAHACTDFGGRLQDNGELGQASRSRWLVDTLMANRKPEHVFYYAFLLSERRQPSCALEPEDDALYQPSAAPGAPDAPRAAASYIWDGLPGALAAADCGEPLSYARAPDGHPVAITWSSPGATTRFSLSVLIGGCTTLTGTSTATFIP
jgi:hypothetical protein